jgi:hypothetical protein
MIAWKFNKLQISQNKLIKQFANDEIFKLLLTQVASYHPSGASELKIPVTCPNFTV